MRRLLLATTLLTLAPAAGHAAGSCTIYVASTGSDSATGNQTNPLASIGQAAKVARAGDTVCIGPGTYAGGIVSATNGTSAAPITYKATTPGTVTIAPSSADMVVQVRGDYTTIDGLTMSSPTSRLGIYMTGKGDSAVNNTVNSIATALPCSSSGSAGIEADSKGGGTIANNTVQTVGVKGCTTNQGIYVASPDVTVTNNTSSGSYNGITQWHAGTSSTITNNTVFDNAGSAITIGNGGSGSGRPSDNNIVTGNNTYGNGSDITTFGDVGSNNTISGNTSDPSADSVATATPATVTGSADVSATIKPGQSLTDADGNIWLITPTGSIMENGHYTPGGGGTSALTIGADGMVYGQDDGHGPVNPGGWFALSGNGQFWTPGPAPTGVAGPTAPPPPSPGQAGSPAPTLPTQQIHVTQGQCGFGVASSAFHMTNGRIIGPDGRDWLARGINVADNDMGQVGQMLQMFPGVNFVRLAIYKYQDPGAYVGFISALTAKGIVVEIEHHVETNGATGGGGQGDMASGTWLAQENAFYQAVAAANKGNAYVWFGTTNEPPNGNGLSQWQQATYQAIRGTGNDNPIMLEIQGWPGAWNSAMDPAIYAQMHNVIWDTHFYGWTSHGSQDQSVVDKALADEITQVQQITGADGMIPALIGEWGPSTTGSSLDANSNQVIQAVIGAYTSGKWGSAVWHWGMQDCCNNLNSGTTLTAPLGQSVAVLIGTTTQTCTAQQTAQNAQNNLTEITQQVTPSSPNETPPAADMPRAAALTTDPSLQARLDQADRLVAQATTFLQSLQGYSP